MWIRLFRHKRILAAAEVQKVIRARQGRLAVLAIESDGVETALSEIEPAENIGEALGNAIEPLSLEAIWE